MDVTTASVSEALLQEKEIELYAKFRSEKLEQDLEDWRGRVHCGKMNKKHMQDCFSWSIFIQHLNAPECILMGLSGLRGNVILSPSKDDD
ncbi:hypothetical protein CN03_12145 [Thalassolituus oleivorans]|uniref:hypothetical protein n=1 Tax=Thalassolituus oleivorans TaxID=187493 RepID=UPI0009493027|nr:hypothetical protein [Thalassolituus oleivorans]APR67614.1 hypothetical protein CN03_12145 [Thalassolituus oleivorans]